MDNESRKTPGLVADQVRRFRRGDGQADGKEIGREPIDYPLVDESLDVPPSGAEGSGHASSGSREP